MMTVEALLVCDSIKKQSIYRGPTNLGQIAHNYF